MKSQQQSPADMVRLLKAKLLEQTVECSRLRRDLEHYADEACWERDSNGQFKFCDIIDFGADVAKRSLALVPEKGIGERVLELAKVAYRLQFLAIHEMDNEICRANLISEGMALILKLREMGLAEDLKDLEWILGPLVRPEDALPDCSPVL